MIAKITDHTAQAEARLKEQFKGKAKYLALLDAIVSPIQDIEDALWQLLTERSVETAEGVNLDNLGVIVGELRNGLSDDDYRPFIRARIATNRSSGTAEELIRIAEAVVDDSTATIELENQYPAGVVLRVTNLSVSDGLSDALINFLRSAKAAGVRIILEYLTSDEPFTFATAGFLNGAVLAGGTTLTVTSTDGFPVTGTLIIDEGLAAEETKAYTGITPTSFTGVSALTNAHPDGTSVTLDDGEDTGLGDSGDATVGGDFASAKE